MKTTMKKMLSVLLLLGLVLSVSSAAFAEQPRKNAVCELYSEDGYYVDDVGNRETYSYHLPQINADTPAALEINAEIAEEFGSLIETQYHNMEGGYSLWSWHTEWKAYWNGSQLFILITADENGDIILYGAYGYDFETGNRVTNEMILEQKGISKEEYLERLTEKVKQVFEKVCPQIPEGVKTELTRDKLLEETLSWLDPEQPMFINQYGEIETFVKITTIAGAGWHNYLVTPFSSEDN